VGGEFVSIIPQTSSVFAKDDSSSTVSFTITTAGTSTSSVKIAFNKLAIVPGSITSTASCTPAGSGVQVVCGAVPSFVVTARVLGKNLARSVELSVILTNSDNVLSGDCAIAFDSISITNPVSACENEIQANGVFCFDRVQNCFRASGCSRKRAVADFDIFPMTYSISYRRVVSRGSSSESDSSAVAKQLGKKLVNSRESACGPRFTFRVNDQIQFLSTQGGDFLSQGSLSFASNATIPADGSQFKVTFETVAINCQSSKLIAFDEHALISSNPIDTKQLDDSATDGFATDSSEVF
jgi:hypothetical protein